MFAPVRTEIRSFLPLSRSRRIRSASAAGTSFGYPAPVNPLTPTL